MFDRPSEKYNWHQHSRNAYQCIDSDGIEVAAIYRDLSDPERPYHCWKAVLAGHPYGQILVDEVFSNPEHAAETVESVLAGEGGNLHLSTNLKLTSTSRDNS